ncbi:MAG: histidine phosphatase family protein [Coriobacteriia bacterium]|nr:histidine phosphatase family protein [Coriobacteriia bacterium]
MTAKERKLLIVRHPQTLANVQGRLVGQSDSPITELGRRQMTALARVVAADEPQIVYTSPLGRALTTARFITPKGTPLEIVEDLKEIDFGDAEGLTWDEMSARGIALDYTGGPVAPGGEFGSAFDARVGAAARRAAVGPSPAVVVTHGGVFRHLLAALLGITVEEVWRIDIPNAAVATLQTHDGLWVLDRLDAAAA